MICLFIFDGRENVWPHCGHFTDCPCRSRMCRLTFLLRSSSFFAAETLLLHSGHTPLPSSELTVPADVMWPRRELCGPVLGREVGVVQAKGVATGEKRLSNGGVRDWRREIMPLITLSKREVI